MFEWFDVVLCILWVPSVLSKLGVIISCIEWISKVVGVLWVLCVEFGVELVGFGAPKLLNTHYDIWV